MSSNKTLSTELSVALGLSGYSYDSSNLNYIKNVSTDHINQFNIFISDNINDKLCRILFNLGQKIRTYNQKFFPFQTTIEWTGETKISTGSVTSKDLTEFYGLAELNYSIKNDSDVVFNSSPSRLNNLTNGKHIHGEKNDNWYQTIAPNEYQHFFSLCNNFSITNCHTISEWDNLTKTKEQRKEFSNHVKTLLSNDLNLLNEYKKFCFIISKNTANIYSNNLNNILKNNPKELKAIIWSLFRIDSHSYILCGTEKGKQFAIKVSDINTWDKFFKIIDICVLPKNSGQPEVNIKISFIDKHKQKYDFLFTVELRWSHGKFCGNPEAKIYKKFEYNNLPWNTSLI